MRLLQAWLTEIAKEMALPAPKRPIQRGFLLSHKGRDLIRWRSKVHAEIMTAAKASPADPDDRDKADETSREQKRYEDVVREAASVLKFERDEQWQKYAKTGVRHLEHNDLRRAHGFINGD